MLLSKAIGGAPTEPAWFWTIFEVRRPLFSTLTSAFTDTPPLQRGIDPHVDDPDHCHVRPSPSQTSSNSALTHPLAEPLSRTHR